MANAPGSLNREALKRAFDSLTIQDLALRRAHIEVKEDCFPPVEGRQFEVQLRWSPKHSHLVTSQRITDQGGGIDHLFLVEISTGVRLIDKAAKEEKSATEPCATIEANFVATYVMKTTEIEQAALNEFATKNVIYHVWPYWREYISDSLARARLPLFTLPMFAFQAPKEDEVGAKGKE